MNIQHAVKPRSGISLVQIKRMFSDAASGANPHVLLQDSVHEGQIAGFACVCTVTCSCFSLVAGRAGAAHLLLTSRPGGTQAQRLPYHTHREPRRPQGQSVRSSSRSNTLTSQSCRVNSRSALSDSRPVTSNSNRLILASWFGVWSGSRSFREK